MKGFSLSFDNYLAAFREASERRFSEFLKGQKLPLKNSAKILSQLLEIINKIDILLRHSSGVQDFSQSQTLEAIFTWSSPYLPSFQGYFLQETAAQKLLDRHPPKHLPEWEKDPLTSLALTRYSESSEWVQRLLEELTTLTPDDFEKRAPFLTVVDHHLLPRIAQEIVRRKCFNTHDKIVGTHILATLPPDFDLQGKSPLLRTVTKMMHYHKEMEIMSDIVARFRKDTPQLFGEQISKLLKRHQPNPNAPRFNPHDVIEGLANRSIDAGLKKLAEDFPELKPWSDVHDVGVWREDQFHSLSLWRLTAWQLYGKKEQSTQMYRDHLLASYLVDQWGETQLTEILQAAYLEGEDDLEVVWNRQQHRRSFERFRGKKFPEAVVIHHVDADGLTGGHIVCRALQATGCRVHRYTMEVFLPEVLDRLLDQHKNIPFFIVDIGSQMATSLSGITNDIYIFDHHQPPEGQWALNIHLFNPRLWGLDADREGCSAINCYFFANAYLEAVGGPGRGSPIDRQQRASVRAMPSMGVGQGQDPRQYLAATALYGATGDGMLRRNGTFQGLDFYPYAAAMPNLGQNHELEKVVHHLNLAGSVGYQNGGIELASELLDGQIGLDDPRFQELARLRETHYRTAFERIATQGHFENKWIVAFNLAETLDPMSLKEVGNFLEHILRQDKPIFSGVEDKYLLGGQRIPNSPLLKVSMRVGKQLTKKIQTGTCPDFLKIAQCFPNQPAGVHALSAAVLIPEKDFSSVLKQMTTFLTDSYGQ